MDMVPIDPDCPIPAFEDQLIDPNKGNPKYPVSYNYLTSKVYNALISAPGTTSTTTARRPVRYNVNPTGTRSQILDKGASETSLTPKNIKGVRAELKRLSATKTAVTTRQRRSYRSHYTERKVYRIRFNRYRIGRKRFARY